MKRIAAILLILILIAGNSPIVLADGPGVRTDYESEYVACMETGFRGLLYSLAEENLPIVEKTENSISNRLTTETGLLNEYCKAQTNQIAEKLNAQVTLTENQAVLSITQDQKQIKITSFETNLLEASRKASQISEKLNNVQSINFNDLVSNDEETELLIKKPEKITILLRGKNYEEPDYAFWLNLQPTSPQVTPYVQENYEITKKAAEITTKSENSLSTYEILSGAELPNIDPLDTSKTAFAPNTKINNEENLVRITAPEGGTYVKYPETYEAVPDNKFMIENKNTGINIHLQGNIEVEFAKATRYYARIASIKPETISQIDLSENYTIINFTGDTNITTDIAAQQTNIVASGQTATGTIIDTDSDYILTANLQYGDSISIKKQYAIILSGDAPIRKQLLSYPGVMETDKGTIALFEITQTYKYTDAGIEQENDLDNYLLLAKIYEEVWKNILNEKNIRAEILTKPSTIAIDGGEKKYLQTVSAEGDIYIQSDKGSLRVSELRNAVLKDIVDAYQKSKTDEPEEIIRMPIEIKSIIIEDDQSIQVLQKPANTKKLELKLAGISDKSNVDFKIIVKDLLDGTETEMTSFEITASEIKAQQVEFNNDLHIKAKASFDKLLPGDYKIKLKVIQDNKTAERYWYHNSKTKGIIRILPSKNELLAIQEKESNKPWNNFYTAESDNTKTSISALRQNTQYDKYDEQLTQAVNLLFKSQRAYRETNTITKAQYYSATRKAYQTYATIIEQENGIIIDPDLYSEPEKNFNSITGDVVFTGSADEEQFLIQVESSIKDTINEYNYEVLRTAADTVYSSYTIITGVDKSFTDKIWSFLGGTGGDYVIYPTTITQSNRIAKGELTSDEAKHTFPVGNDAENYRTNEYQKVIMKIQSLKAGKPSTIQGDYASLIYNIDSTPKAYRQASIYLKKAFQDMCPVDFRYLNQNSDAESACMQLYDRRVDNYLTYRDYFQGQDAEADAFFKTEEYELLRLKDKFQIMTDTGIRDTVYNAFYGGVIAGHGIGMAVESGIAKLLAKFPKGKNMIILGVSVVGGKMFIEEFAHVTYVCFLANDKEKQNEFTIDPILGECAESAIVSVLYFAGPAKNSALSTKAYAKLQSLKVVFSKVGKKVKGFSIFEKEPLFNIKKSGATVLELEAGSGVGTASVKKEFLNMRNEIKINPVKITNELVEKTVVKSENAQLLEVNKGKVSEVKTKVETAVKEIDATQKLKENVLRDKPEVDFNDIATINTAEDLKFYIANKGDRYGFVKTETGFTTVREQVSAVKDYIKGKTSDPSKITSAHGIRKKAIDIAEGRMTTDNAVLSTRFVEELANDMANTYKFEGGQVTKTTHISKRVYVSENQAVYPIKEHIIVNNYGTQELMIIDPKSKSFLKAVDEIDAIFKDYTPSEVERLYATYNYVTQGTPYSGKYAKSMVSKKGEVAFRIDGDEFLKKPIDVFESCPGVGGVCRHQAIMETTILNKYYLEGKLPEPAIYAAENGHAWAEYMPKGQTNIGEKYILDPAQGYFGKAKIDPNTVPPGVKTDFEGNVLYSGETRMSKTSNTEFGEKVSVLAKYSDQKIVAIVKSDGEMILVEDLVFRNE